MRETHRCALNLLTRMTGRVGRVREGIVKKVVLAYSGGLDTSCLIRWLKDKDYEVICREALDEMRQPDFQATWNLLTVWGSKP